MPRKTVEVFLDSLTLEEIPSSSVVEVPLSVEGATYQLFLSPDSRKKLDDALAPFLRHEKPVVARSGAVDRAGRTAAPVLTPEERAALTEWAARERDRVVAPRGRVALGLFEEWVAAGKPGL